MWCLDADLMLCSVSFHQVAFIPCSLQVFTEPSDKASTFHPRLYRFVDDNKSKKLNQW